MKFTDSVVIFTICVGFSLYIIVALGIGGPQLSNMQFWNGLVAKAFIVTTGAILAIVVALFASGVTVTTIIAGGAVGNKIGEATSIGFLEGLFVLFAWTLSEFIYKIPEIGPYLGMFCGIFFAVILVLDVVDRVTTTGG